MLDTQTLFWWLRDDPKLGPRSRALIAHDGGEVLVSIASLWEASIKFNIGKLAERGCLLWPEIADEGFELVPITREHLGVVETLPRIHGDPFDHLILAQAKITGAAIITSERDMTLYGVPCIPAAK